MSGFLTPASSGHPGYVSGNWYCSIDGSYVAGGALAASSIRLLPFQVFKPVTVAQLAARVTTVSAGGNFQLAIYANNPATGRPTGTALCSTGSLSTASAAAVAGAVTSTVLPPGTYWMAVNQDNAVAAYQTMAVAMTTAGYLIGSATLANVTASSASGTLFLAVAQTFGTWPDLTGASFTETTSPSASAVVFLKAA